MAADESRLTETLIVDAESEGQRIDAFLAARVPGMSRSRAKTEILAGRVLVNGEPCRPKDGVAVGDEVRHAVPELASGPTKLKPHPVDFGILYEDDDVIVINKPRGLVVHPGAGTTAPTLVEGLLAHFERTRAAEAFSGELKTDRPGVVHRLDKDTTGVMVCAKTVAAHEHLAKQFKDKTNLREYVTLLDGILPAVEVDHSSYLYRDPKQRTRFASLAEAAYEALETRSLDELKRYRLSRSVFRVRRVYGKRLTLAVVTLHTGRTHQIRVHAKDLGVAVVGDLLYHRATRLPESFPAEVRQALAQIEGQLLHARVLGFTHPRTGRKMAFEAPLPSDFRAVLELLEQFADRD